MSDIGYLQPVKLATVYKDNRMYSYFNIADNQYLTYELAHEAASKIPAETHFVTLRLGTLLRAVRRNDVHRLFSNLLPESYTAEYMESDKQSMLQAMQQIQA